MMMLIPEIFFQGSHFISLVLLNLAVSEKRLGIGDRSSVDLDADAALELQLQFLQIMVLLFDHFVQLGHFVLHFIDGHFNRRQDLVVAIDHLDALLDVWKGM